MASLNWMRASKVFYVLTFFSYLGIYVWNSLPFVGFRYLDLTVVAAGPVLAVLYAIHPYVDKLPDWPIPYIFSVCLSLVSELLFKILVKYNGEFVLALYGCGEILYLKHQISETPRKAYINRVQVFFSQFFRSCIGSATSKDVWGIVSCVCPTLLAMDILINQYLTIYDDQITHWIFYLANVFGFMGSTVDHAAQRYFCL